MTIENRSVYRDDKVKSEHLRCTATTCREAAENPDVSNSNACILEALAAIADCLADDRLLRERVPINRFPLD